MMHSMDVLINTLIVLAALQAWTLIGYLIITMMSDFETLENPILSCFFWVIVLANWAHIKILEFFDNP